MACASDLWRSRAKGLSGFLFLAIAAKIVRCNLHIVDVADEKTVSVNYCVNKILAVLTPSNDHSIYGGSSGHDGQSNFVPICVVVPRLVVELFS